MLYDHFKVVIFYIYDNNWSFVIEYDDLATYLLMRQLGEPKIASYVYTKNSGDVSVVGYIAKVFFLDHSTK